MKRDPFDTTFILVFAVVVVITIAQVDHLSEQLDDARRSVAYHRGLLDGLSGRRREDEG